MRARVAIVIVLVLGVALLSDRLRVSAHSSYASAQAYEDVYYLPPREWLRVFSMGFDEALADLIWMRALVYYGEEFQHRGRVRYVFEYADAIVALDPHFRAVYSWVATAGLYRPQAITPADAEHAFRFMQRGARLFPEDGELAWDMGAVLVFELTPLLHDPAARDRARERGMPYLMRAVRLGAAPDWVVLTNASILERIGRTELAARHLEEMYFAIDDPQMRRDIAERIVALRQSADAEAFRAAAEELEADRQRDFPYLSPTLYLLVGKRPPVDTATPMRDGLPGALAEPSR